MTGRCARTAASFWVFLTLGATDFLCFAKVGFNGAALRLLAFLIAFFGTRLLAMTLFLTAFFLVTLFLRATRVFEATLTFCVFRAATLFATALLAFGRAVLGAGVRLFAADFGEERRATAREVERLRLFVTALISKVMIERPMWTNRSGSCGGRVT